MPPDKDGKPACSTANASVPLEVECTDCGMSVEVWTDEPDVNCPGCGNIVKK